MYSKQRKNCKQELKSKEDVLRMSISYEKSFEDAIVDSLVNFGGYIQGKAVKC